MFLGSGCRFQVGDVGLLEFGLNVKSSGEAGRVD